MLLFNFLFCMYLKFPLIDVCAMKDFFVFFSDCSLKFLALWPPVIYLCIFLFKKQIVILIKSIKEIRIGKLIALIIKDPNVSNDIKVLVIKYFRQIAMGSFGFFCRKTKKINNITGDGTLVHIPFEISGLDVEKGVYTANEIGVYFLNWYLNLEGITDQEFAMVKVEAANESLSFSHENIQSMKTSENTLSLSGNTLIQLDAGDTVNIKVKVGNNTNSKTVSLLQSQSSFFCGFMIKEDCSLQSLQSESYKK